MPEEPDDAPPKAIDLGHAAAAHLSGEWQLEAEPIAEPEPILEAAVPPPVVPKIAPAQRIFPDQLTPTEAPPSGAQIIEAMLFVGGPPLTAAKACSAIRGLKPDQFREFIDELMRKYRMQNRPYSVQPRDDGFVLAMKPKYREIHEKLQGGPREARLSQPALDVLSLIAYRQPLSKPEVDALRGNDSAGPLRQLVRLGMVSVVQRADAERPAVSYGTTNRFLELFGLSTLDELPRLGDVLGE